MNKKQLAGSLWLERFSHSVVHRTVSGPSNVVGQHGPERVRLHSPVTASICDSFLSSLLLQKSIQFGSALMNCGLQSIPVRACRVRLLLSSLSSLNVKRHQSSNLSPVGCADRLWSNLNVKPMQKSPIHTPTAAVYASINQLARAKSITNTLRPKQNQTARRCHSHLIS